MDYQVAMDERDVPPEQGMGSTALGWSQEENQGAGVGGLVSGLIPPSLKDFSILLTSALHIWSKLLPGGTARTQVGRVCSREADFISVKKEGEEEKEKAEKNETEC